MRKIICVWVMVLICVGVIGCASPQGQLISPKSIDITSYEIGKPQTKTVGEPMVIKANGFSHDRYIAKKSVDVLGGNILSGSSWEALYTFEGQTVLTSTSFFNRQIGIIIDNNGDPIEGKPLISSMVINSNPLARPMPGTYLYACKECKKGMFEKDPNGLPQQGSRKEELIYSGRSGNTITLNYREFTDNFARPAFYQEAKYDLSSSKILTFRDFKIKVINADNSSITFEIL